MSDELPTPATPGAAPSDLPETRVMGNDVEGAVPPGYDWPTHGGYLGCLLGLVAGCLIGASLTPPIFGALTTARLFLPGPGFFLVLAFVVLASISIVGRLGYVLGKRLYRYYPQPSPTWGESDAEEITASADAASADASADEPEPGEYAGDRPPSGSR